MDFFDIIFWENPIRAWGTALGIAVGLFLTLSILKRLLFHRAMALARETKNDIDDLIIELLRRSWVLFLFAVSLYGGTRVLDLPSAETALNLVLLILILIQLGLLGSGVTDYLVARQAQRREKEIGNAAEATTLGLLGVLLKGILWMVLALLALDSVPGVEITTLIAGLGVGGVAVALAVQTILGDLFASLSIVLDKPFVIGDFINVGDFSGSVEHVGLKSTRLRSITGEQVIFANSDLLASRIRNYGDMEQRRASFTVGVAADTPPEKLKRVPELLQEIVEAQEQTIFRWACFSAIGDFSMDFQLVYTLLTSDYQVFLSTRQAINMEIVRRFGAEGIELPYPTQTVLVRRSETASDLAT